MTFSSRRKRPTTRRAGSRLLPKAIKALAAFALSAGLASAQTISWQGAPATTQVAQTPTFGTTVYTRAPDEPSESVIGPDARTPIVRTNAQLEKRRIDEDDVGFVVRTDLPGQERLFDTRKSEATMQEYIRRDSQSRTGANRILFPEYEPVTRDPFQPRALARSQVTVQPNVVCHGRLYFEQPNFERGGWDLGPLTVPVNVGVFAYDVAMLPYHRWTRPCDRMECNVGKIQPGDASPFYLYREPFSVSGLAAQTLTIGGGFFIFP